MDWHKENKKIEQNDKTAIETIYIELFKSTLKVSSQIAWKIAYFENFFWDFSGLVVPKNHGLPKANVSNFQKTSISFWKLWFTIMINEKDKGKDAAVREIS